MLDNQKAKEHFEQARVFFDQAKLNESIKEYEKAFKLDNHLTDALIECADAYILKENYKKAKDCLLTAIKTNPNVAKAYNNIGFLYIFEGDNEKGDTEIKKAAELDSKYISSIKMAKQLPVTTFLGDINDNYGVILQKQKQLQKAIPFHERALKYGTTCPSITNNNLGWAYYSIGNFKKAIYYYDEALKIEPGNTRAMKNRELAVKKMAGN